MAARTWNRFQSVWPEGMTPPLYSPWKFARPAVCLMDSSVR